MPRDTSPRVSARFRVFCNFPVHRHDKVHRPSSVMPAEDCTDNFSITDCHHARGRISSDKTLHTLFRIIDAADTEAVDLHPKAVYCSKSSIVMGRIVKFVSFMLFFIFLAVCLSGAVFYKTASHAVHLGRMAAPQPLMGTSEQDLILPPHRSQIRGSYSALPGRLHL